MEMTVLRKYLNKTMYRNKQVTKYGFRNTRSNKDIIILYRIWRQINKRMNYVIIQLNIKQKKIVDNNNTPNTVPLFLPTKYHCLWVPKLCPINAII